MRISKKLVQEIKTKSLEARRMIAVLSAQAKLEHIGSAFSAVEVLESLYWGVLRIKPKEHQDPNRDRFILSKGHAALALYVVLNQKGFIAKKDLLAYGQNGSKLSGHPVLGRASGIEASAGSLGHGLSLGAGLSYAAKMDGKKWRTFVLLSDGECNEGSVWEAVLFAGHQKLDNLIAIIDYNKIQSLGATEEVLDLEPFAEKWRNAGWEAKEVEGHNIEQILTALQALPATKNKPTVIIAHTVKGKGWPEMEDKVGSHYKVIRSEELDKILKDLY